MFQLYVFFVNSELDCICEAQFADMAEQDLTSRFNDIEVRSIIGRDEDDCWTMVRNMTDKVIQDWLYH